MGYSYQRNEAIIRSKTKELFGVGAVVTASSYLVLVVDFMLIGWILGADAVAAAGLCDSFVDVAEFPGFVISSSGPIAAGILMGKRQYRQADGVFTLSFLTALTGGILCWCLLPFCDFFGSLLAGGDSAIAAEASRYTFFVIAASPFIALNLVISQFAILDNHFRLAMGQVITANAVNIVLDIVLMKFLHMGVAGASAASMAGNIAGIAVGLPYLLSRKRTFHFTLKIRELREVIRALSSASVSFSVDKASRIFSTLIVNLLLMHYTGSIGVALYAVCGRLKFVLRILAGGALQTISNLGSMLYGERDFFGIRNMLSLLFKYTYAIVIAVVVVLAVFSSAFLRSYGIDADAPGTHTLFAFRFMLLSLPFLWCNELLARFYPVIQRQNLSVLLLTLQYVVCRILILLLIVAAIVQWDISRLPAVAVWCFLTEAVSLAVTLIWEKIRYRQIAIFGMKDRGEPDCHTFSIAAKPESVADIHREIDYFCHQNEIPRSRGNLLSIAFEEAVLNIINHGRQVDTIDICLLLEDANLIVRIRDNGTPFDPLAYEDEDDILHMNHINLLERLADQKTYTRIMNMNNTVLSIRLEASSE